MQALFERFSIEMTAEEARSASHAGACDSDVEELVNVPAIRGQLDNIPAEDLAAELQEYGAWAAEELQDHEANCRRIVWIAAGDIRDMQRG